jgi:hypothetical protein
MRLPDDGNGTVNPAQAALNHLSYFADHIIAARVAAGW